MNHVAILNLQQFRERGSVEGFHANTLENHLVTAHKDIAHPHAHNFYLAILFTHGSGVHEVDFTSYKVGPGSLFLLNPGQTHHWELSDDVRGYVFFHTQEFYNLEYTHRAISHYPFFYSMYNSPLVMLGGDRLERIKGLFAAILAEHYEDMILKAQRLLNLADLVYIEATRVYAQQHPADVANVNSYYVRFRVLEDLIEKHFLTQKSPAAYAAMMHMTPKHLNRIVRAVAGKSTGEVIAERVMLEAKKLLVLQKQHFNEVAYMLGYDDYAYFSRVFKNRTGETPSSFLLKYSKS